MNNKNFAAFRKWRITYFFLEDVFDFLALYPELLDRLAESCAWKSYEC